MSWWQHSVCLIYFFPYIFKIKVIVDYPPRFFSVSTFLNSSSISFWNFCTFDIPILRKQQFLGWNLMSHFYDYFSTFFRAQIFIAICHFLGQFNIICIPKCHCFALSLACHSHILQRVMVPEPILWYTTQNILPFWDFSIHKYALVSFV